MGLTLSDRNQLDYIWFKSRGCSDEEIAEVIGVQRFNQMKEDMKLTPIESHFGMKDVWFYIMLFGVFIGSLLIMFIYIK